MHQEFLHVIANEYAETRARDAAQTRLVREATASRRARSRKRSTRRLSIGIPLVVLH